MTPTEVDNDLVPGSLPARVLEHMHVARGEFDVDELAEALQVDPLEVRNAIGSLRKAFKVTARLESGKPLYRAAGTSPETIPGSSLQVIGSRPTPAERRAPAPPPEPRATPKDEPMKRQYGPAPTRPALKEKVLAFLVKHRGGHTRDAVIAGTGVTRSQARIALKELAQDGAIERHGATSNALWQLPGKKDGAGATADSTAKPRKAARRAPRSPANPNLAHYGKASPRAKAGRKPGGDGKIKLAIDAEGNVAIEELRLAPVQVAQLVDFLTKAQHLWQGASR